ncbi:MAG TPA: SNF2-related protein [Terriglobia bacterium]|nr:SNF2-related protein [Terriglobia bacterium]
MSYGAPRGIQPRAKLSNRLSSSFDAPRRQRGQGYFWQGRVRIRHGSSFKVEANVRGSLTYEVSLDFEDGVPIGQCDCPYFDSGGPCKHLWATILAAEERGYLTEAASARKLILDCDGGDPYDEFDEPDEEDLSPVPPSHFPLRPRGVKLPAWRQQLAGFFGSGAQAESTTAAWPAKRQIHYVVDTATSVAAGGLALSFIVRDQKVNGDWNRPKPLNLKRSDLDRLPLREDREILAAAAGGIQFYGWGYPGGNTPLPSSCLLLHPLSGQVMQQAARTGRCYLRIERESDDMTPLVWDDGGAWRFGLEVRRRSPRAWEVAGVLRRGDERMDLAVPALLTGGGLVFTGGRVAPLAENTPFEWIVHLRAGGSVVAPERDGNELLAALLSSPGLPALEVPEELRFEEVSLVPRPCLRIRDPGRRGMGKLRAELIFDYDGRLVPAQDRLPGFFDTAGRRFLRRDSVVEKTAVEFVSALGLKFVNATYWEPEPAWEIAPSKAPRIVRSLVEAGWHVEAEGKAIRRPGAFHLEVSTGVDWFELHGKVEYGEAQAKLPELLEAVRLGENMVRLDDGTFGVVPEEWMRRIGMLAGLGTPEKGHLRFRRSQAGLLDALLAAQPEARCDESFTRVREELRHFQGIEAARQPASFVGHLRDYQREGLGWMEFLRRFSFGGCLADDMGVGKTAQTLALLETRRELKASGEALGPSLVVVPRSLVFNWKQEAARFTPQLRVLDYTGLARSASDLASCDVVLTTYGTLRRDVLRLKDVEFDYVVLDEAQAIKNAATEAAKAVRLIRGGHRLALSGTPVENHLGELWSLFEFLNPGMLGRASVFKLAGGGGRNPDQETRQLLAHALRPFILRRTKDQVAPELPAKSEQTVYCELESAQRRLYDELRRHYRDALLKRIEVEGLAKSKIQVLEALLRLRQAACHPGLIDARRTGESSAKLGVLLEQVREVLDEGHKALVFSQFTSLLTIVRDRLDAEGIAYEYLDGATRDRQARVEHFQNEADCRLFLVSLKAGGLGLNLTAAEYVFLLDPWWNPAVEAQAVDRAHRIGQTRRVFAYRLIARDTVEEKVLELQKTKRDLAAAIISADNSLIRNLGRDDLELLLS